MNKFVKGAVLAASLLAFATQAHALTTPSTKSLLHRHTLAAVLGAVDSVAASIATGVPDTLATFQPWATLDLTKMQGTVNTTAHVVGKLFLYSGLVNGGTAIDSAYFAIDTSADGTNWNIDTSWEGVALIAQTDRAIAFPLFNDADALTGAVGGWWAYPYARIRILTDGAFPACRAIIVAPR
jgi:hypothetical protein